MNSSNEIYVRQFGGDSYALNGGTLIRGKAFNSRNIQVLPSIINNNKRRLEYGDVKIDIPYHYFFGALQVLDISKENIIIYKTEVAPNIPVVVVESHIQMIDLNGNIVGSFRVPTENMTFIPNHMVKTDNGKIYLLSIEEESVVVYRVLLGGKLHSTMDELISNKLNEYKQYINNRSDEGDLIEGVSITGDTGANGYLHRSTASARASAMINYRWTIVNGNLNQANNTILPGYLSGKRVGDQITAIPYKWGGADGVNEGAGGRNSFLYYQSLGYQTGDVNTNKPSGFSSVTGVDCSGFVGLSWYRTDIKYSTSTLHQISNIIDVTELKHMDALNSSGFHTVLYQSSTRDGVNTKESTIDNNGRAQDFYRSWDWLTTYGLTEYLRYKRIVDDGLSLPEPTI